MNFVETELCLLTLCSFCFYSLSPYRTTGCYQQGRQLPLSVRFATRAAVIAACITSVLIANLPNVWKGLHDFDSSIDVCEACLSKLFSCTKHAKSCMTP